MAACCAYGCTNRPQRDRKQGVAFYNLKTMSRRRKARNVPRDEDFHFEQLQIYGGEDHNSDLNGSEAQEISGVQVKFEPDDTEYESAIAGPAVGLVRAFPVKKKEKLGQNTKPFTVKAQVRQILENKAVDPRTASQNVENAIEDLLKKNADLLAQNDALNYKPYSRRGRIHGEIGRSREVVFPNLGQSTTFAAGPQLQGRIMLSQTRGSQADSASTMMMGQLMRPKSPTRRCNIHDKDKSHIGLALMETKVGDQEGEMFFNVQKHEMVCAISSETKFADKDGRLVSSVDIHFYWCNFCPFSTTSKTMLMQHVIEHRFNCKHCRYQSYCRSDIIHHSIHSHPEFQEQANVTQYCTFLSDYLRIKNPKEQDLDAKRKRKDPEGEDYSGNFKMQTSNHLVKRNRGLHYDLYDISLEQTDENGNESESASVTADLASRTSSSSVSLVSSQADVHQASLDSLPTTITNLTVLRAMSPVPPAEPDTHRPVISQVFSAGEVAQALTPSTAGVTILRPATDVQNSSAASPSHGTSAAAGRNNLYWSCGYCPYTSRSQSGIKSHSVHEHSGRPYRYVALIKAEETSTTPPSGGDESATGSNQNVEPDDANGSSSFRSLGIANGSIVANNEAPHEGMDDDQMQSEEPPILVKQEPLEPSETPTPIKVRFPAPRIHSKDNTSLKCFHCDYASRILGPLRNHILANHKGECLVGLAGMNSKVFMCPRVDCTFRSSSGQNFLKHSLDCTPWNDNMSEDVEPHQMQCLHATTVAAEEAAPTSSASAASTAESKVSYEKFSCLYCKCQYTGSKTKTKQHVLKFHGSKCLVIRNVQAHSRKRRSSVFFCRWCHWEGDQKLDYDRHLISCQEQPKARQCLDNNEEKEMLVELEGAEGVDCSLGVILDAESDPEPPDITWQEHFNTFAAVSPSSPCLVYSDDMPELGVCEPTVSFMDTPVSHAPVTLSRPLILHHNRHSSFHRLGRDNIAMKSKLSGRQKFLHFRKNYLLFNKHTSLNQLKGKLKNKESSFGNSKFKSVSGCKSFEKFKVSLEKKIVSEAQCCICYKNFETLNILKAHLLIDHPEQDSYSFISLNHKHHHLKSKFYVCPFPDCCLYRCTETDIVQHYRTNHSHYSHEYLNENFKPATVEFRRRNLQAVGKIYKSLFKKKDGGKNKKPSGSEAGADLRYLCLYCNTNKYADTVPEMKAHHSMEHPGQPIIFRDVVAHRGRKASRLSVCHHKDCHFSSFEKDALKKHESIVHSLGSYALGANMETYDLALLKSPSDQLLGCEFPTSDKSFQCTTCGWITADESAVTAHVAAMHAKEGGSTVVTFDLALEKSAIDERFISV